jgi:hypothetical protein
MRDFPDLGVADDGVDLARPDLGDIDLGGGDPGADLGPRDLGMDLGPPDLGMTDLGADLGPPDLGTDLGPPDLGCAIGATRPCATTCGTTGTSTCAPSGTFGACMPPPEVCNGRDENCDGVLDDGLRVQTFEAPFAELTAAQPACATPTSGLDVCLTSAHRWCAARDTACFLGGAGIVAAGMGTSRVHCIARASATLLDPTFAEVTEATGIGVDASVMGSRVAQSAAHRFCGARGFATGIGPVEHAGGRMQILCMTSAMAAAVSVARGEAAGFGCDPAVDPGAIACATASDAACRARGFAAGFGPVEWNTEVFFAVCMRP